MQLNVQRIPFSFFPVLEMICSVHSKSLDSIGIRYSHLILDGSYIDLTNNRISIGWVWSTLFTKRGSAGMVSELIANVSWIQFTQCGS